MEKRDNWTTLLQRPVRCRQPRSNSFRDKIGRSPRASTALRLGKCRLNSYLHKIALHDIGTCDRCGEAETIEHYLISCSQNKMAAAVKNICDQLHITDDTMSGSGPGSDPSPDSATVMRINHGSEA